MSQAVQAPPQLLAAGVVSAALAAELPAVAELSRDLLTILLAHSAHETGLWHGRDLEGVRGYNLAGLRHHEGDAGDYYEAHTHEYRDGQRVDEVARFRAYASLHDGVRGYLGKLQRHYPAALQARTVAAFVVALHPAQGMRYSTTPRARYLLAMQRHAKAMEHVAELTMGPPDGVLERDAWLLEREPDEIAWYRLQLSERLCVLVTRDALTWGGVRWGMTAHGQQRLADSLPDTPGGAGAMLLTPAICDAIASHAARVGALLGPHPRPVSHRSGAYREHSAELDRELYRPQHDGAELVAGWKDWCLSADVWRRRGRVTNYGWHVQPGARAPARTYPAETLDGWSVLQPASEAHNGYHADYSQMVRLVARRCYLDGHPADLADALTGAHGPQAAQPVGGVLPGWRMPGVDPLDTRDTADSMPRPTRPGERGAEVVAWQRWLAALGYTVDVDGAHGPQTEIATVEALRVRGLAPADVPADIYADDAATAEPLLDLDAIPFSRARYFGAGRPYGEPLWIVIHTAEIAELPDSAERLQRYAATMADGRSVSWHYAVDADSITASVRLSDRAYAAGPANDRGVHIELAGTAAQGVAGWRDDYSRAALGRLRQLLRALSKRLRIPLRRVDASGLLVGTAGVCGHADVSAASREARVRGLQVRPWWDGQRRRWRTTTHGDPGPSFPWEEVLPPWTS